MEGNQLHHIRPPTPGIHTTYLYISGKAPGTPFAIHVEDYYLYSVNYLHKGARKYWQVICPSDRPRLEEILRRFYPLRFGEHWTCPRCGQFVRHLSVYIPETTLQEWGIGITFVVQSPGDLVITFPGAPHQGWNGGWNVAEAMNYAGQDFPETCQTYRHCFRGCHPDINDPGSLFENMEELDEPNRLPIILTWSSNGADVLP